MTHRSYLLTALAAVCLAAAWPGSTAAYIKAPPQTLGGMCLEPGHIAVLKVEKVNAERGVIFFKHVEQLKGTHDGSVIRHVIKPESRGAKIILDWAAEGKTAVMFYFSGGNDRGHVCIDDYWYWVGGVNQAGSGKGVRPDIWWHAYQGEPVLLSLYCGKADQLADAVKRVLRDEEVVVPAMVGDNKQDLEQRRAKIHDVHVSLKLAGADSLARVGARPVGKKGDVKKPEPSDKKPEKKPEPGDKKSEGKKFEVRKPDVVGTVKAVSDDGKSFTMLRPPTVKSPEPTPIDIQINKGTTITVGKEPGKLTVGQIVSVWFGKSETPTAATIEVGKPGEKPAPNPPEKKPYDKKPEKKPEKREADRTGTVKALSGDGKRFTLSVAPTKKNPESLTIDIQINESAKITMGKEAGKLAVGQTVNVWMQKGSENVAAEIRISTPSEKPEKKPLPDDKPKKTDPSVPEKKLEPPAKPKEPAKPARDPAPTAALIDKEVDQHLASIKVPASAQADDAEFLRRVTLDLTGRVPTHQRTVEFLDSKDPEKRRKLIDELLESQVYGEHSATVWRNLIVGRPLSITGKGVGGADAFRPWLAEQFNSNRGWNAIVTDLLTADGTPRDNPATTFLMSNTEDGRVRPNKVAGAAASLFWGLSLRCAECHTHPFSHWTQNDFWGTAAFFSKLQYGGNKGGPPSLAEVLASTPSGKEKGQSGPARRGTAIVIPTGSGKAAGQAVKARFLGADEATLDEDASFRPRFAEWATAANNPYFARAAVNRMWAHFFGCGFVNPLDNFDESNPPSHPALLDSLAKEFASSGFDLKHLARCVTNSKTYQRTHLPAPGNEADTTAFSRMSIKVLTPEVFFDSLAIATKGNTERQDARDQFIRSFRFDDESSPTEYIQGIPQLLRLMNGPTASSSKGDRGALIVDKLVSSRASHTEAITTLYLATLSRRPSSEEVELMSAYLSRRKDEREGFRGVLWILLNSSEFALNH